MVIPNARKSTWLKRSVYHWLNCVQYGLFPPECCLCQRPGEGILDLCGTCRAALCPVRSPCRGCGLPLPAGADTPCGFCLQHNPHISTCCAPFRYAEPLDRLISGFKYHRRLHNGRLLARLMTPAIRAWYPRTGQDWPTRLIPVPLHPAGLRRRGFNQSALLARWLGREFGLPVVDNACRRLTTGPAQQSLKAADRRRNLHRAFGLASAVEIRGETVAIVDDVVTTLSTASALAGLLREGGAREVQVWAVARTIRD